VRSLNKNDLVRIINFIREEWGSDKVVTRGKIYQIKELPGFIALKKEKIMGLLTYNIYNNECEIITLNSTKKKVGIGSFLLEKVEELALSIKCNRLWVITTNDNTDALCFYQKKGFRIFKVHIDSIKDLRRLKPEIPFIGLNNIEIRDEIELEKKLK
jgi:GNAT superfamily N-acetyltransferase